MIQNLNIKKAVTLEETSEGEGVVTHYDVMFEHGIEKDVPVDKDNDGVTDQVDGEDVFETVKKKQVTIVIKQDKIEEKFRRLFLAGT